MKKFISAFVLLAALCLAVSPAMAANSASYATNNDKEILTYVIDSATQLVTAVSTSTIIPGKHRILGFEVAPRVSGAGTVTVSLYDTTSTTSAGSSATGLFAETVGTTTASQDRVFIYPKSLDNGLTVLQGAGTTVTIYYERYQP